ncbi:MAG: hypothetical protein CMF50_03830 [Legionellales bacterium]|nr:hypothetical protein [Legionellales bacterium]|tara:strand:- start:2231 stop:2560 length:330 start_codon:yes stop_codon:yes gene_type:complete
MNWKVSYFNQDVVKNIEAWPKKIMAKYLRIVDLIEEHGAQLGPPITDSLGDGLFEIRVKAQEGIGRAFFCYILDKEIIVLHAIIKKTQKTPKKDLELAKQRMKEVKNES